MRPDRRRCSILAVTQPLITPGRSRIIELLKRKPPKLKPARGTRELFAALMFDGKTLANFMLPHGP